MKVKNRHIHTLNYDGRLPKQKTVIVFGVGRGGTSAMAGVLREFGVILPNAHPLKHEWSPVCWHDDGEEFHWEICVEDYAAVQTELSKLIMFSPHPIAAVSYETLIRDPASVITELSNWLEINLTDEVMAAAQAFVSSPARYRSVSTHPHSGRFDAEETTRDRTEAQVRLYAKSIEDLERSIVALAEDIQNARLVVTDLIESVHQLIDAHRAHLLPSTKGRIPMEFFSFSDSDFISALFMNKTFKVDGVPHRNSNEAKRTDFSPPELPQPAETNAIDDLYVRLLNDAYVRTKRSYMDIIRQRMRFQHNMDNVASKRELIKNLTKSA
jgi:hypothetical protein